MLQLPWPMSITQTLEIGGGGGGGGGWGGGGSTFCFFTAEPFTGSATRLPLVGPDMGPALRLPPASSPAPCDPLLATGTLSQPPRGSSRGNVRSCALTSWYRP